MLVSMTGFGRAEAALAPTGRAIVEVRCLNHRFLELETRLPDGYQSLEEEVRAAVGRFIRRGQVRVSLNVRVPFRAAKIEIQTDLARRYLAELKRLQKGLGLAGPVTLKTVLSLPQVVSVAEREEPSPQQWRQVRQAFEKALGHAAKMRSREGARTAKVLERIFKSMEKLREQVIRRMPEVERQSRQRYLERLGKALAAAPQAPEKSERSVLLSEAGAYVQGSDVSEELARLQSHLAALRKADNGRTIDFLAQELHREVNTLGNKLRDGEVTRCVVAMKGEIEKLREQAANIE